MGNKKMQKITLKNLIKDLAKAKITGKPLKYDYYIYDNHGYGQITSFDLLRDRFTSVNGNWNFYDCNDKNIRLYRERKDSSKEE